MRSSFILFLIITSLVANVGCSRLKNRQSLKFSGTLEFTEHLVGARVPGRLATLMIKEGDMVKQGQLLGTLDRFDQAKRNYERTLHLYQKGGTSEQAVEEAALALDDQQIVSPVDGVVLVKVKEIGEVISAGIPVADIGDQSELWVRIYVPEGSINQINLGQTATLHVDGVDQSFKGKVSLIATKAEFTPRNVQTSEERVTQAFAVKVTVENPPPYLRPGVAADVIIHLKD